MIQVLHLRDTDVFGGPEKTILESVRLGSGEEFVYAVALLLPSDLGPRFERMRECCEVIELDQSRRAFRAQVRRIRELVDSRGIDILHSHDFRSRALAVKAGTAIHISTAHGHIDTGWKSRLRNAFDRRLLHSVDRLIVVSDAMQADMSRRGLVGTVVRNSIVLDHYPFGHTSHTLRADLGWSAGEYIVGCIGRLSREKGQLGVIRAISALRRSRPQLRLVFAGDGPDRHLLEMACERAGLSDVTRFLGHRPDMLEVYGGIDLLVLNSSSEGMPNVVLEALAMGVPVVATAVGGTPELVRDGLDGLLCEAGDAASLEWSIKEVLLNPEAACNRALSGRARVESRFAMEGLVDATHAIYREELERAAAVRASRSLHAT